MTSLNLNLILSALLIGITDLCVFVVVVVVVVFEGGGTNSRNLSVGKNFRVWEFCSFFQTMP